MRKYGGLQEAGALFSWESSVLSRAKHPLLRWRFKVSLSNLSTCSTTSEGSLEQDFGARVLHPSLIQHTFVRSVPEKKRKVLSKLRPFFLIQGHGCDVCVIWPLFYVTENDCDSCVHQLLTSCSLSSIVLRIVVWTWKSKINGKN